jgi:hypothetical protein
MKEAVAGISAKSGANAKEAMSKLVAFVSNPANHGMIMKYGLVGALTVAGLYGASVVYKRYKKSTGATRSERLREAVGLGRRKSPMMMSEPEHAMSHHGMVHHHKVSKRAGRPLGSRSRSRRVKLSKPRKIRKTPGRPRGSRNRRRKSMD